MEHTTRAAVYARVSTAAQDGEPQLAQLRRFVSSAEWSLYHEYFDTANGESKDRPALARLMRDAFDRRFDVVVVWRFDRFGRSLSHLIQSLEEFQALHIGFVSVSERFDTSTPLGKMTFGLLASLAEFETSLRNERVALGIAKARERGVKFGRRALRLDAEKIAGDYAALKSLRKTAALHRCSDRTVWRIVNGQREVSA